MLLLLRKSIKMKQLQPPPPFYYSCKFMGNPFVMRSHNTRNWRPINLLHQSLIFRHTPHPTLSSILALSFYHPVSFRFTATGEKITAKCVHAHTFLGNANVNKTTRNHLWYFNYAQHCIIQFIMYTKHLTLM